MIKLSNCIFNRRSISCSNIPCCSSKLVVMQHYHGGGKQNRTKNHRYSGSNHSSNSFEYIKPGSTALDYDWSTFPVEDVPNMLYQLNKRRDSNEKNWNNEVFTSIARKLRESPGSYENYDKVDGEKIKGHGESEVSKRELTNIDVAKLFFGLNLMPERHPCVAMINDSISYMLSHNYNYKKYPWTAYNVSCAMYHLRGLLCEHRHVRDLILIYTDLIGGTSKNLEAATGTTSRKALESSGSRGIIDNRHMTMMEFNNTLYGLQGLSSNTPVVRDLITVLLPHLERSAGALKLVDIVINGDALCVKPAKASHEVESRNYIDNLFLSDIFALQKLSSEHDEVRKLIHLLQCMIRSGCIEVVKDGTKYLQVVQNSKVRAIQACRALFGLQNFHMRNSDSIASGDTSADCVRLLLDGLSAYFTDPHIIEGWMHPKDIALVLDGMRLMYTRELEHQDPSDNLDSSSGNNGQTHSLDLMEPKVSTNMECIYHILNAIGSFYDIKAVSAQLNTEQMVRIIHAFRGYKIDIHHKNDPIHQLLRKILPYLQLDVRSVNKSRYGVGSDKLIYRRVNSGASTDKNDNTNQTPLCSHTDKSNNTELETKSLSKAMPTCAYDGFQVACIKEGLQCILKLEFDDDAHSHNRIQGIEKGGHMHQYKVTQQEIIKILLNKGIDV